MSCRTWIDEAILERCSVSLITLLSSVSSGFQYKRDLLTPWLLSAWNSGRVFPLRTFRSCSHKRSFLQMASFFFQVGFFPGPLKLCQIVVPKIYQTAPLHGSELISHHSFENISVYTSSLLQSANSFFCCGHCSCYLESN